MERPKLLGHLEELGELQAGDLLRYDGNGLAKAIPGVDYGAASGGDISNGAWCKLYDGMLFCWGEAVGTQTDANGKIHMSYPVAGAGTLVPIVTPRWGSNSTIRLVVGGPTAQGFDVYYFNSPDNTPYGNAVQNVTWFAIGRWK